MAKGQYIAQQRAQMATHAPEPFMPGFYVCIQGHRNRRDIPGPLYGPDEHQQGAEGPYDNGIYKRHCKVGRVKVDLRPGTDQHEFFAGPLQIDFDR